MRLNVFIVEDANGDYEAIEEQVMDDCTELGMRLGEPYQEPNSFRLGRAANLEIARNVIEEFARLEDLAHEHDTEFPGLLVIFDVLLFKSGNESLAIDYVKTLANGLSGHASFKPRIVIYSSMQPQQILKDRKLKAVISARDIFWKWELMEPEVFKNLRSIIEQEARRGEIAC